ncbi:hypothetical protein FM106_16445 [Brachybacterium faecium]|nr:hypothetical protein FM106_16445 [Brachybacterium faecium]
MKEGEFQVEKIAKIYHGLFSDISDVNRLFCNFASSTFS